MKYRIVIAAALLMLVVLTGVLLIKSTDILTRMVSIEDIGDIDINIDFTDLDKKLVNYLEDAYGIELEAGEVVIWPVNQIMLKEVKITEKNNRFSIYAPEMTVYYDLVQLIMTESPPASALNQISLKTPVLNITDDTITAGDDGEYSSQQFMNELLKTASFQLKVDKGKLVHGEGEKRNILQNLDLTLRVSEGKECRLALKTGADFADIIWNDQPINPPEIDDIELVMLYKEENWQGVLETGYFQIPDNFNMDRLLQSARQEIPFTLSKVKGQLKTKLYFSGEFLSVDEYRLSLTAGGMDGKFEFDQDLNLFSETFAVPDNFLTDFESLTGNITYDSSQGTVDTDKLEFSSGGSDFVINGDLQLVEGAPPRIYGHLTSGNLELGHSALQSLLPEDFELNGRAALDITAAGIISDLDLSLGLTLPEGSLNQFQLKNLRSSLRYRDRQVYLDQLTFTLQEDNIFNINGIYDQLQETYSVELSTSNLKTGVLKDLYLDFTDGSREEIENIPGDLSGEINLSTSITGRGFEARNIGAGGELEIAVPESGNRFRLNRVETDFYLGGNKLLLKEGIMSTGWGELSFAGETGLAVDESLDLQVKGEKLNIGNMSSVLKENLFTADAADNAADIPGEFWSYMEDAGGRADFGLKVGGTLSSPVVDGSLSTEDFRLADYIFDEFTADINYDNEIFAVEEVTANYQQTEIGGKGTLEFLREEPDIDFTLSTSNLDYSLINQLLIDQNVIKEKLPLTGGLQAELEIGGRLNTPGLKGFISSADTVFQIDNREIILDDIELILENREEGIGINNFRIRRGEAYLFAGGDIVDNRPDIDFNVSNLFFADIYPRYDFDGRLQLTGKIAGSLNEPEINGELRTEEIKYSEQELGEMSGDILFAAGKERLQLDGLSWIHDDNKYIINGDITNILSGAAADLQLETEFGQLSDFTFLGYESEFGQVSIPPEYYFKGKVLVDGELDDLSAGVDLVFHDETNPEMEILVAGDAGRELNLELEGKNVEIKNLIKGYPERQLSGFLDFSGSMSGGFEEIDLVVSTSISEGRVANLPVDSINGRLMVNNGQEIYLDQKMVIGNSHLNVDGEIPLAAELEDFNIQVNMVEFPLELVSAYDSSIPEMGGSLTGDVEFSGSPSEPSLNGRIGLEEGSVDFALPEVFSGLKGEVNLLGREIKIEDINGKYGDGNITLTGLIKPFAEENLDLNLTGSNLPFDYGSFDGRFDPELRITGSFVEPYLEADLYTHDMVVGLPVEWSDAPGEAEYPDFNLTLYPGENVYLRDENIDVVVQEGSLNISGQDDQIEYQGSLESEEGTFNYYNNKFIVEEAGAVFERYAGHMPELNVRATTNVSGTRIDVQINGTVDDMITTFTSSPPLSDKEILALLTSKGGIGEFVSGNWETIFTREIFRLLHNQLQLDFVDELQENLRKIFELDRFELDTYNLGWDNEMAVYLGKHFNEKLYLEYSAVMRPEEREDELSLRYYLTDSLLVEGSWDGEDDYSLSIETNLEF